MRRILSVKNQTVFDIAVQEYGNVEAAFQILADNPHLAGMNDLPSGYELPEGIDFDIAYPIREGQTIYLQQFIEIENTQVAKELETVIS
jgi:hypothetical protein